MSNRINFNRKTFIEKEELNIFQSMAELNSLRDIFVTATNSFGIVKNDSTNKDALKVTKSLSDEKAISINRGYALQETGDVIVNTDPGKSLPVSSSGNKPLWLYINSKTINTEQGTVSVSADGVVTGTVNFSRFARGVQTKVPVFIKFIKNGLLNTDVYYIQDITSYNTVKVGNGYGGSITTESDLSVVVLGSLPIGEVFTNEQLNGLYSYDSYELVSVQEVSLNTEPSHNDNHILLSRITFNGDGTIASVEDKRKNFWFISSPMITTDMVANGAITKEKIGFGFYDFDYVIDSNDKLLNLPSVGPDIKSVLVKKGTWVAPIAISLPNTLERIIGEAGSTIDVQSIGYISDIEEVDKPKYCFEGVNIIMNNSYSPQSAAIFRMCNFRNSIVSVPLLYSSTFQKCTNVYNVQILQRGASAFANCRGVVKCNSAPGLGKAFISCRGVERCDSSGAGYDNASYYSVDVNSENLCQNTLSGGFNK